MITRLKSALPVAAVALGLIFTACGGPEPQNDQVGSPGNQAESQGGEQPENNPDQPAGVAQAGEQSPDSPDARDTMALVDEMKAALAAEGIDLDDKAGTLSFPAQVGAPRHPVEWLLVNEKGKVHECLLVTQSKASLIHGGMLALGFKNGKNVRWQEKDPLPSRDEIMAGAEWLDVFPPEGMPVWLTFEWKDEDGKVRALPVEDLLVDVATLGEVEGASFVYLGGRLAQFYRGEPEKFAADFTGNLMSVPYMEPANHLVTMVHERCQNESNWWLSKRCPPAGTEGKLTLHRTETAVHKARAQRIAAEGARAEGEVKVPDAPSGGSGGERAIPASPEAAKSAK